MFLERGPPVAPRTFVQREVARLRTSKAMNLRPWIFGLSLAATMLVSAKEVVSIRVTPSRSFAPATVIIRATIEPDTNNRAMEVVADSDGFYRSSVMQLEGERGPKTTTLEFRGLPPGEYNVTASVIDAHGERKAVARAHVEVIE